MRTSLPPRPPKSVLDLKKKPQPGDRTEVELEVLRVGRDMANTADVITVRVPGHIAPVTATGVYLLGRSKIEPADRRSQ